MHNITILGNNNLKKKKIQCHHYISAFVIKTNDIRRNDFPTNYTKNYIKNKHFPLNGVRLCLANCLSFQFAKCKTPVVVIFSSMSSHLNCSHPILMHRPIALICRPLLALRNHLLFNNFLSRSPHTCDLLCQG